MATIAGWLKLDNTTRTVTARGPLLVISQHFLPRFRSSARCQEPGRCFLCESQIPSQTAAIVPVDLGDENVIHLLRLTTTQAELSRRLQAMGENLQGHQFQLQGRTQGALQLSPLGKTITSRAHVEKYVEQIGQGLYSRVTLEAGSLTHLLASSSD